MDIDWAELLAIGLLLWTLIGLLGSALSWYRNERRRLVVGLISIVGVWVLYLAILFALSYVQPERRIPLGGTTCFHSLCYTVETADEIPGFPLRNHVQLERLILRVTNHGHSAHQEKLTATLRDAQGRFWPESSGVSGNPFNGRILPGSTIRSAPVFRIGNDSTGLVLLLQHPRWSLHTLILGDPDSFAHRPQVFLLQR